MNFLIDLILLFFQIQLSNGKIFEGIFSTFSPQLEVVLELVHTVDPSQPDKIDIKTVSREVVFGSQMIVMMSSKDVELDYATKGTSLYSGFMCLLFKFTIILMFTSLLFFFSDFATDSSISRFNGLSGEKELEPWEGDGDECNLSLDNAVSLFSFFLSSLLDLFFECVFVFY